MSNKMYDNITGRSPIATDDLGYFGTGQEASQIISNGTTNYNKLTNKPSINSVELTGNKSLADIGAQPAIDSSHKLSADLVDDTNATNKFATAAQLAQIAINENNISTLTTNLQPTSYSAVEVETDVPITVLGGGFVRIGNLVCINLKISITGTISQATRLINGLPKPLLEYDTAFGAVSLTNNLDRIFNIMGTGYIAYADANPLSSGTVILSGMYIAHS